MSPEELQQKIYDLVEKNMGKKKMKAGDITKAMEAEGASRAEIKAAIRELVDGAKLVYSYFGGSFIEVPHKEGSANP
ncbi:MAG TPA: hypothetical protein DCO77_00650 [Nitrospiraceae bacterium]|nr:hypothetical protein [Nitrospiraceae bacterium]